MSNFNCVYSVFIHTHYKIIHESKYYRYTFTLKLKWKNFLESVQSLGRLHCISEFCTACFPKCTIIGKRVTRVVNLVQWIHWIHHVPWTSIGHDVHRLSCPMAFNVYPFPMFNGHVQWIQWMSNGSICVDPMDTINKPSLASEHQFGVFVQWIHWIHWTPLDIVSIVFNGHDVQWTQWIQWIQWTLSMMFNGSNGNNYGSIELKGSIGLNGSIGQKHQTDVHSPN